MYRTRFRKLYSVGLTTMLILSSLISIFLWDGMDSAVAENPLTPISTITGPDKGDNFGWNVSWVGDVNGDGYDDIIAGAPYADRYFGGDWWNPSWSYRKKLTFDNSGQTEDLLNFPVLVNLSSSNFDYLKAKLDGTDLRFIDEDGVTELKYHIEDWNSSEYSYVWVNVTNIAAGSSTDYIWMYYGNMGASDVQDVSGTYDASYVGVWHLNESSGNVIDSTSNDNDGTESGGVTFNSPGWIDGAIAFDGLDDVINVTDDSSLESLNITVSLWFKRNGDQNNWAKILSKGDTTPPPWGSYKIEFDGLDETTILWHLGFTDDTSQTISMTPINDNQWYYVVGTYNGTLQRAYLDGVEPYSLSSGKDIKYDDFSLGIGAAVEDWNFFNGTIDEIRISNVVRSADWIMAQYLSMNNSFITHGNEETKDWWDTSWSFRKKLTFDNSGQSEDLVNFPILVNLSSSNFEYSKAKLDGTDLRFIDEDGVTELNYEIESWNSSGSSFIWVNVTNISASSSTDYIWMYYGNSDANDGSNPEGVWDSNYVGVWHLKEDPEDPAPQFKDSTSNHNNGTANGSMTSDDQVDGLIDGTIGFDGGNERIDVTDHASLDFGTNADYTLSAWIKTTQAAVSGDWPQILVKRTTGVTETGYAISLHHNGPSEPMWKSSLFISGTQYQVLGANDVADGEWHYLVVIRNGSDLISYEDGDYVQTVSASSGDASNTQPLRMGKCGGDGQHNWSPYIGNTTEVRVSNVARSADWIKAQYLSMNNTFITYGSEEALEEDCGAAYIFFGHPGITLNNIYASDANVTIYGSNAGDLFGWSVSDAGDVNNDGYDDVIIGAPGWGADKGKAYIFHGRATSSWNSVYDADTNADVILNGENDGDKFGFSVSGAGNMNSVGISGELYEGWLYRKKITINSSQVLDDLTNFPILINITDSDFQSKARSDGYDIFFTELDGATKLDHEIERNNNSIGELISWVRIPFLSSSKDTVIYMYYGNSGQTTPMENPTGVWDDNYVGVWHLAETSGNAKDSTSYGTDGTVSGTVIQGARGQIDGAYEFDGSYGNVNMSDPVDGHLDFGMDSFTLSIWIKDYPYSQFQDIVYKGARSDGSQGYALYRRSNNDPACWAVGDTIDRVQVDFNYTQDGTWRYIVCVADRSTNTSRVYVNGIEQGSGTDISTIGMISSDFHFQVSEYGNEVNGTLDEVRMVRAVRSLAWILTEFNNQNDTSTFYTVGTEEIIPQNWLYRKRISINSSKVTGDLTDFPMLINITDSDLQSKARPDGYDILFTKSDGRTTLDHEIENYNSSSGELIGWIKIPSLSSSSDTIIYMYYGKTSQSSSLENPADVWDSNYLAVWHMNEEGDGTADEYEDRTSNSYDGRGGNGDSEKIPDRVTGKMGWGQLFDGSDDYIDVSCMDPYSWGNFTISAWYKSSNSSVSDDEYIFSHVEVYGDGPGIAFGPTDDPENGGHPDELRLYYSNSTLVETEYYSGTDVVDQEYHYLVITRNSTRIKVYDNGNMESDTADANAGVVLHVDMPSDGPYIGDYPGSTEQVDGIVDELRISIVPRSADWIVTEFNNQNDTSTFYTVGNEEIISNNWQYRKPITINSSKVTGDLTDFPMLIQITDIDLKSKARSDGFDIIFTGDDGWTRLDHEIESYNTSSGELVAWVKIPMLSSITDTLIYMNYGNSEISSPSENPSGVWSNGYEAVWHFAEESGSGAYINDSTGNGYDGTPTNTLYNSSGKIDGAREFYNENDDRIIFANSGTLFDAWDNFTLELWWYPDYISDEAWDSSTNNPSGPDPVLATGLGSIRNGRTRWAGFGSDGTFQVDFCFEGGNQYKRINNVDRQAWSHLVYTYDGNNYRLYKNGVNVYTYSVPNDRLISHGWPFQIGSASDVFNGSIDELRVSRNPYSPAWFSTLFNNTNDTSTFYTMGNEEIIPVNWLYRKPITINASSVAGDLNDFPMLIDIIDSDLKNKARSDGYDIMFTESDGKTRLDHEIERYNSSSGELIAWVKIPFLSSSSGTLIYMYYGNPDALDQQNIEGVWSNGFVGVYHMVEETGSINNSASSTNDGTRFDTPTRTMGQIGYGQEFTGTGADDYFNVGNLGIADGINENITISAWANIDNAATENYGKIVSKRNETDNDSTYRLQLNDDPDKLLSLELNGVSTDDCIIAKDTWVYITASYNGSVRYIFINETQVYNGTLSGPLWGSSKNVYIGVRKKESSAPDSRFGGILDEVRLSKAARSASWVITEFNNQNDTSTFYSVGSEEFLSGDNYDDVIIGAYGYGSDLGRAYIFFGESGFTGEFSAGNADVIINGTTPNDRFGWYVSRAGDVNNDGFGDVIIGAPGNNSDTGAAYIFFGDNFIPSIIDDKDADVSIFGGSSGDEFGFSLSFVDDVNNDGFDDVIIGAPGNNSDCGAVYIFFGNDSMNSLISVINANVIMLGESTGDRFGFSVHSAGDVNGDGVPDVIVGAPYHDNGATTDAGAVYVFEGGASMDNIIDWSFKGEQANDHLGWSVSFAGNLCGDGSIYLIAGAPNNDDGGVEAGKTYILTIIANKPVITNVLATPSIQNIGGFVNITSTVTALSGVDEVWVNITLPDGGYSNISMTQGVGDQWYYNDNYSIPGLYQYSIWANDTLGNWTESGVYQFQVVNSPPLLSSPQVDSLTGYIDTEFNFTVTYTDLDNHPPNNITVNITGIGVYDLIEVDPSDTNYTDGKEYYYNTSGFSIGLYSFHFAANDTLGDWDETVEIPGLQIFNTPPVLLSPEVDPLSGTSTTFFNFTVNYTDLDDHPPGNITLNLTGPSGGTFDLIEVDPSDTIYSDGKEYYYNTTLSNGSYSYHFAANDSLGFWEETIEVNLPLVGILKPILNEMDVSPNSGYVDTWFNFTVNYTHILNLGPYNITLNLTGPSGGIFELIEVDPLDTNYTDGKLYFFNMSNLDAGQYTFHFSANDTLGNWTESVILQFDVVNRVPMLSLEQVDPIIGYIDTWFNFTVMYTDLDNHPSDIITVNITGVGVYDLIEVDPLDSDYTDGKEYYYNISGFSLGQYSFHFAANDTFGNWTESTVLQFDVIDREPMLSLNQVDPTIGYIDTWFNFTVTYTDLDNNAPFLITVNVTGVGVYSLLQVDPLDNDYTDGKAYYYNATSFALGQYSFHFAANNTLGNWVETGTLQFDVINRVPTLSLAQVNPSVGDIDSTFNFTVVYTDLDNQPPDIISVNITGIGVYDLFALDPLDMDYTDGKAYYYNTSGFAIGSYSFHFAANDTQGDWIETIILNFDVIDRVPTLLFEQVNPNTGYTDTWFNFTVTYADLDNHAPDIITVNITGVGVYSLFALDPLDMDYTDGKVYYNNISGFAVGSQTFHFAANDTFGNWIESGILQFDLINWAPTLSLGQVDPTVGYTDTWFNFTVLYTDLDDHAPYNITLNLTGLSGGIFDLLEVDPSDSDYSDGKEYYLNTTLTSDLYSFHFAANDSLGLWAIETMEINAPNVVPKHGVLYAVNFTKEYSDDIYLNATLLDDFNNPISNENVAFYIDINKNGSYEAGEFAGIGTTLVDGSVSLIYTSNLSVGTYYFTAVYVGSGGFVVDDGEALLTIIAKEARLTATSDVVDEGAEIYLTAFLIDNESDPIGGEQVAFYIDKNKNGLYEGGEFVGLTTTSASGVASVSYTVNLIPESYGILARYLGSSNYAVSEIEGLLVVQNMGNIPPTINGIVPDQIKPEDSLPWGLDLTFYEADAEDSGPDLKWYLTGVDTTLYSVTGMNSSDDVFTFIPVRNAFGNDEVILWLVDSSGDKVSQVLWVNITPVNDPPYFAPAPPNLFVHYDDPSTEEDDPSPWDYTFYVHDIETPVENLIITTSEPTVDTEYGYAEVEGLEVTFHYPQTMVGQSVLVFLTLSDGSDTAQAMILVNVTSNWVPERVNELPDVVLEENSTLYNVFDLDDYFIDKDADSLYFSSGYFNLMVNINEDNTVDITALGQWTGSEFVTFRAEDPTGAIAEDTINVTVIPVNDPPEISGVPDLVVHYDYSYAFDLSPYISDPDNLTSELIVWTSELWDYIWLQQSNKMGIVVDYPESMNGTTIPVTIYVSDGIEIASQQIQISVTNNFPPELVYNLPDIFFDEDTILWNAFCLSDYFFDIDSNVLYYTNGTRFINATINENLTVDFSAPENWYGFEWVTFRATDPTGALAEDKILVVVVPVNDAPTIDSIPKQEKKEGDEWLLDLSQYIHDVDNNASELIITIRSEAGQDYITLAGNILMFQYPEGVREDIITITVSDGELEASRSFTVDIKTSEQVIPTIWDLIPWPWVFLFLISGIGGAFAFYKKKSKYLVYDAFLIHENGLPMAHVSHEESSELEDVVVSGMFTAVQNFINDTFSDQTSEDDWELDEMKFGDHKILIERSQLLFLAVIFEGYAPKLRKRVKRLLYEINEEYGSILKHWDGNMARLKGLRAIVASLVSKDKGKDTGAKHLPAQSETHGEEIKDALMDWKDTKKVGVEELGEYIESVDKGLPEVVDGEVVKAIEIEVIKCPVCGKDIQAKASKCPRCGIEFVEIKDVITSSPQKMEDETPKSEERK